MSTDISKCTGDLDGEICPLRQECHRYVLHPNPYRQAYLVPLALGNDCEFYWPVKWEPKRKDAE